MSYDWGTIDRFWIDDQIYWTLWYSAWLHFKTHYYTHTHMHAHCNVHSHIFTSLCSVAASNSRHSPSSGFLNYPQLQLPVTPNWLTLNNCSAYNSSAWTTQKTAFLCCSFQLLPCRHACLQNLLSNGCCIAMGLHGTVIKDFISHPIWMNVKFKATQLFKRIG
jgi:hypothetical protein